MPRILKLRSSGLTTSRNIASSKSPKSHFKMFRKQIEFSGPFTYLKHNLNDLFQDDLFDAHDALNIFVWPFDSLKHRFIEFTKVVFWDLQKTDYEFSGPFTYLKPLKRLQQSRFFFFLFRMQKMSLYCLWTLWHIASPSSPNWFLKTLRRQIMRSNDHSTA
jgi:hypothetical protein